MNFFLKLSKKINLNLHLKFKSIEIKVFLGIFLKKNINFKSVNKNK
jgi:hypothetical protein